MASILECWVRLPALDPAWRSRRQVQSWLQELAGRLRSAAKDPRGGGHGMWHLLCALEEMSSALPPAAGILRPALEAYKEGILRARATMGNFRDFSDGELLDVVFAKVGDVLGKISSEEWRKQQESSKK
jgi:hypothetical protein